MSAQATLADSQRAAARVTLKKLLLIIPVMLVFCASLVPLYRQICEVLGITASKAVAVNTQVDTSRRVVIEFDSNLGGGGGAWRFEPVQKQVSLHPGEKVTINYRVTNTTSQPATGRAVPSIGPIEAGLYFQKLECFCFSNQTLAAGETRDMPVTFYVDPKMPSHIGGIALSYTFFSVESGAR